MTKSNIIFFKSLTPINRAFAIKVLNDPKYDNNPLINKEAIESAIENYRYKLTYLKREYSETLPKLDINIEGRFLAQNIPEIPSIVIDEICTKKVLYKTLNKYDASHIALSTYATGLDKTINIIKLIKSEFKDLKLYIGGVGTVYPHLQELVDPKNICVGNGVNWLRQKFNLKPLLPEEFSIPKIFGSFHNFPVRVKTAFLITQIGCPNNCDFCITTNLLKYNPFSTSNKIIKFIEELSYNSNKDIFLFVTEPNAFYPEQIWKKVFDYFIENPKKIDKNLFLVFEGSLNHINKFDLEKIQKKSPLKFLIISCGIESTLNGGYLKNQGNPHKMIERLNNTGIFVKHNFIIGLPIHSKKKIDMEIKNNLKFKSDFIAVNTFKPIPLTPLYDQLKSENRLYNRTLPPEFLFASGFLPFRHEHLGGGFKILEHLFKAAYEIEKKTLGVYDNFANKMLDILTLTDSRKIKQAAKIFMRLSKLHFKSFQVRMPYKLSTLYKKKIKNTTHRYKNIEL